MDSIAGISYYLNKC